MENSKTSLKGRLYKKLKGKNKNAFSDFGVFLVAVKKEDAPDKLKLGNFPVVKVSGCNLPEITGVEIEYIGRWTEDKKYGLSFRADSYILVEPKAKTGIINFLSSKAFPGIGQAKAEALYDKFGDKIFEIIKEDPLMLLAVDGMTVTKALALANGYRANQSFGQLSKFLSPFGLSTDQILKINEYFGEKAAGLIKKNPYIIQGVKGIGFSTCDKIGKLLNAPLNSRERIEAAAKAVLQEHISQTGNTVMAVGDWNKKTLKLLNEGLVREAVFQEDFQEAATYLIKVTRDIICRGKQYVTTWQLDLAERKASEKLKALLSHGVGIPQSEIEKAVTKALSMQKFKLSEGQVNAVRTALSSRVAIITGGPGTGKSTILSAILDGYALLNKGKEITLLSPTGKAARRMSETTGEKAQTIHSKLHIFEGALEPEPLPTGLVVIDESSMVDAMLLHSLTDAMPMDGQLLFIGDKDQLPSVGAGSVLNDMIESGVIPVAKLTEIYRQKDGSSIIENAQKINTSHVNLEFDKDFSMVSASGEEEALEKIKALYQKAVAECGGDNVALLTPLRRLQKGRDLKVVSDNLNKELQEVINPDDGFKKTLTLGGKKFIVGDKVLQWKNTDKSSNGDIGIITDIREVNSDVAVCISWENGNDTVETRVGMQDISLAYSISIHKSQGSQYDCVIIPMLRSQKCSLFKRNLLYTAVIRAKKKVIIVGDEPTISYCIRTEDAAKRATLFKQRLQQ